MSTAVRRVDQHIARNTFSDTTGMTNKAQRLLADIRELAPEITLRTQEIEAGRHIPPDLVETLRSIAVFRMLVPQSHGGLELDLPAALKIIVALSRIDGSVGCIATVGAGCDIFASLLPRETYEHVYQNGPDVIIAGSAQPAGTAEAAAGGWPAYSGSKSPTLSSKTK